MDEEHQELFRLAGDIYTAIGREAGTEQLLALCTALANSMRRHFSHEEALMQQTCFASTNWHKQQHAAAKSKLAALRKRLHAGDADAALAALHFIAAWLRDHTSVADRILAAHVRNAQRTAAAC
jgi:hemerythrin